MFFKKEVIKPSSEEHVSASSEDEVRRHWKEIRNLVRQERPQTEALLNSCRTIRLDGNKLKLGFESELLKNKNGHRQ